MKIQIKKNSKFTRIDRWPHFINVSIRISCVLRLIYTNLIFAVFLYFYLHFEHRRDIFIKRGGTE